MLARPLPFGPDMTGLSKEEALPRLAAYLRPRIEATERGEVARKSVTEIVEAVQLERRTRTLYSHVGNQSGVGKNRAGPACFQRPHAPPSVGL